MSQVVFLRGVNVGGHRTFKPSQLASDLKDLDVVNIGAAGTFVARKPLSKANVRKVFQEALPFETDIMMCSGKNILELVKSEPFADAPKSKDIVPFVNVLAQKPKATLVFPFDLPKDANWLVRIIAMDSHFVLGLYKRHMKAISLLGQLDRLIGTRSTTRNWNTINAIAKALQR